MEAIEEQLPQTRLVESNLPQAPRVAMHPIHRSALTSINRGDLDILIVMVGIVVMLLVRFRT